MGSPSFGWGVHKVDMHLPPSEPTKVEKRSAVVAAPETTPETPTERKAWGGKLTGNAKSLIMTSALFLSITLAQYIASLPRFSNSLALRADCLSMLVDGLSYLGNLAAECNPNKHSQRLVEMAVSGISLSLLLGFTIYFAVDAIHDIVTAGEKNETVDPRIVLAFATLGLVFDVLSLFFYVFWNHTHHLEYHPIGSHDTEGGAHQADTVGFLASDGAVGGPGLDARHRQTSPPGTDDPPRPVVAWFGNMNMMSALLHVGSDFLRSLTTLVEAAVILNFPSISSVRADGVSALVVCIIIGVGSLAALLVWLKEIETDLHVHMSPALTKLDPTTFKYIHFTPHPTETHATEQGEPEPAVAVGAPPLTVQRELAPPAPEPVLEEEGAFGEERQMKGGDMNHRREAPRPFE